MSKWGATVQIQIDNAKHIDTRPTEVLPKLDTRPTEILQKLDTRPTEMIQAQHEDHEEPELPDDGEMAEELFSEVDLPVLNPD